jgi:hypothetical protein
MFTNITWSHYALAILVLFLLWYSSLVYRFYSSEVTDIFSGRRKLRFHGKNQNTVAQKDTLFSEFKEPFETLDDARELFHKLKNAFAESDQQSRTRDEFKNYIKFILEQYPYIRMSALRAKINDLTVSLCQKCPRLNLTYAEMDGLWQEDSQLVKEEE